MTSERLNEMMSARPFRPFAIRLADGELVRVEHPEFIARSPNGRTVVVFGSDDHMKILDVFLVTSLETVPPGKNGRKRRR
jgi:hypothetical protein